ncbi:putative lipid A biosynthesis acyltransferase [Klebsiella pneumoniae]|nr:putative lipid A biosynthesis acyltransferase [Klebsiella pneumoniae]
MACVFNKQLLHPRNWLTWFGLGTDESPNDFYQNH